jgi:hypothetical protein
MPQTKTNPIIDSVETAAERIAEFGEKAVANGLGAREAYVEAYEKAVANTGEAGEAFLTSYEKAVVALADTYEKAAGATKIEWIASLGGVQADATREMTRAYTSAAREFLLA